MKSLSHETLTPAPPGPAVDVESISDGAVLGEPRRAVARWSRVGRHRALLAVLGCYVVAAFVVPTLAPVAVSDDWLYARTVERWVDSGVFEIPDLAVANLVFQVVWGGLFTSLFGMTLGVLRLSTVALTLLSGAAFYGLTREMDVSRGRGALGTAVYLFNPLGFVLGFTFMTDAVFTPLLVISAWLFARGLRRGNAAWRSTLAGSVVASFAFLVRQQGVLIPLAVMSCLLASGHLRLDRASLRRAANVAVVPVATIVGFYLWLAFVHGMPDWQGAFAKDLELAGFGGTWLLIRRLAFIEPMYLGLLLLPLTAGAGPRVLRLLGSFRPMAWRLLGGWSAVLAVGLVMFARDRRMPYIPHFLSTAGIGPSDLVGGGTKIAGPGFFDLLTAVSAASALVLGLLLAHSLGGRSARADRAPSVGGPVAGLCLSLVLWQAAGTLLPSFHFRNWSLTGWDAGGASAPSLDRYLLPLVPLGICLALWALREVRLSLPVAWGAVAVIGVVSVAGTRDSLHLQAATWKLAREARAAGVPDRALDGGAAWDGYHMSEASKATTVMPAGGPWWIFAWAPAIDSTYVISLRPQGGYDVVGVRPYSAWLKGSPTNLHLLRRSGSQGPLHQGAP